MADTTNDKDCATVTVPEPQPPTAEPVPEQCKACLWYVIPHAAGWWCGKRRTRPTGVCGDWKGGGGE